MKRTLAFLLSLMMVLSMLPAAALAAEEAPVSEAPVIEAPVEETPVVEETPAVEEAPVELLADTSNALTRMDMVHLLVDAFGLNYDSKKMTASFTDVTDASDAQAVAIAVYYGFVSGTSSSTFAPDGNLTRAQVAVMLTRALELESGSVSLPDDVAADAWYVNGVAAALSASVMTVKDDNLFHPNDKATMDDIVLATFEELAAQPLASGDCGAGGADNLQWALSRHSYELTITGSGAMEDYSHAPWYDWAEDITAVSLPEGLTHLGGSALYKCSALTQIDLPDSLESIGSRALAACHSLKSLHIPAKVREFGSNALGYSRSLTKITVDAANANFYAQDNFLLTKDGKTLVACPGGLTGTVTLPAGITTVGNYAGCGSKAEAFVLPDSLTTIENGGFRQCNLLETIEIPAGVTQVVHEAFFGCVRLQSITFKGNAPTLGNDVFGDCADTFCIYYDPATTGWSTPEWNGWPAYPIGTLAPAPAATDLRWDVGITAEGEKTAKGWFSFYGTNGIAYEIKVYYRSAADSDWTQVYSKSVTPVMGYFNQIPINYHPERCQTGDYSFTVQALGDGETFTDGEVQTSAVWSYIRPTAQLTATDLSWSADRTMSWTLDETNVLEYQYAIFFNAAEDELSDATLIDEGYFGAGETILLSDGLLEDHGTGWYYFGLIPITYDPTVVLTASAPVYSGGLYYEGLPAADAPVDLQWQNYRNNSGSTNRYDPNRISFGRQTTGIWEEFRVDFYRKETSGEDTHVGRLRTDMSGSQHYRSLRPFRDLNDVFTTGTYYFTVTPMGDGETIGEGEPVRSPDWVYSRPDVKLALSDIHWGTDMSINWTDAAQNGNYLDYYRLQYQFVGQGDTFHENEWNYSTTFYPNDSDSFPYPPIDMLADWGNGKYYFRVRAISGDINEAVCSDWSDWSEAYTYTRPATALTVSDLKWDGNILSWTPDFDPATAPLAGYQIYIYEDAGYATTNPRKYWGYYGVSADATAFTMPSGLVEDLAGDTWYFAVTTVSANPNQINSNYGSAPTCKWTYTAPANKLGTPTDLKWHEDYSWQWNETTQQDDLIAFTRMGAMSIKRPVDANGDFADQAEYEYQIYRIEADGSHVRVNNSGRGIGSTSTDTHVADIAFIYGDFPSGTYYFKARCRGDGVNYASSDWATSDTWTYTRPTAKLETPTGLYWDDRTFENWETGKPDIAAVWTPVDNAVFYSTEFRWSDTENGAMAGSHGSRDIRHWDNEPLHDRLREHTIAEYGEGWYFFSVRAVPADITQYRISEWSAYSIGYDLDLTVDKVNDQLDSIDTSTATAQDIQQAVAEIDHLDKAMAADAEKGTTDTLDKLKDLEDAVKSKLSVTTKVEVDSSIAMDKTKIKAVNMALNINMDAPPQDPVTLNITTPADPNVVPPSQLINTQNENTVIFSMDIDGAVDASPAEGKQLKIPVQITLPVPAGINPAFLVILHEKSDGDWEELTLPHVYEEDGQWYATFNVHSFSHYAMGEKALTAQAEGNTVTLQAHLPTKGVQTSYLCAVYSAQGQMLGVGVLKPQSDDKLVITLDQEVPAGATMLIFAPDAGSGWAVHSEPAPVTIVSK